LSTPLPDWAPADLDLTKPSAARMYDYYLGGAHNFGVDRELAKKVMELVPDVSEVTQANRAFLHRAVRYLTRQGIRQFIDIGSGIPTQGSVHETAHETAPEARVLYVDHDQVAVAHSELLLGTDNPTVKVLQADLRHPGDILASAQLRDLLDLSQPVAVLMVAVLHFISEDDDPAGLIRQFHDVLAPGSYLVISHSSDDARTSTGKGVSQLYQSAADPFVQRSRAGIKALFDGWDLVDPGLVWLSEWRPEWPDQVGDDPSSSAIAAGIGRKP
jgi:SAM-dependent methyltransferase